MEAPGPTISAGNEHGKFALKIRGRIRRADGRLPSNMSVHARSRSGGFIAEVEEVGRDGAFELEVPEPGEYDVEVAPNLFFYETAEDANFLRTKVQNIAAGTDDLVVDVEAGLTIRGVVIDPDGAVLASRGEAACTKANATPSEGQDQAEDQLAAVGPNGQLVCVGLQPGTYEVTAWVDGWASGAVVADAGAQDVRVQVRRGGVVRGCVIGKEGHPVAGAEVELRAVANRRVGGRAVADSAGRFEIRGAQPGSHRVYARWTGEARPAETGTSEILSIRDGGLIEHVEIRVGLPAR